MIFADSLYINYSVRLVPLCVFNVCVVFYRPVAATKVAHPCRIMSVLLLGALGHRQIN